MRPRTLLCSVVSAVLPVGLWGGLAFAGGPSPGGPGYGAGGAAAAILAGAAGLLLFLAYRLRSGADGPGLAAAAAFASFPSLPDAMASDRALPLLGGCVVLASLLLYLGRPREGGRAFGRMAAAALFITIVAGVAGTLADAPAPALFPARVLYGPFASVLAGEAATRLLALPAPARGRGRLLVLLLALVLVGGAGVGAGRALSWATPLSFWERAHADDPSGPAVLGCLAEARGAAGDGPGAAAALRRFAERIQEGGAAGAPPGALRRGAEGAVRAAVPLLRSGGPAAEAARAAVDAALLAAPRSPEVLRGAGERLLADGDFPGAVRLLEDASTVDALDPRTWDALARALLPAARNLEALGAAQRATGLDPSSAAFARTYAETLLATGRGSDALMVLRASLGAPPFDPVHARAYSEAHRRLALQEVSAGRSGRARRLLAAGLQVDPASASCRELKRDLDERYEAERPTHEALLAPGADGTVLPDNLLLYASWLCRWGDFEKARPHFEMLLEKRGGTAAVHFQVGKEYWEGQGTVEGYEKAILSYRDALARDPGYVEARNRLWQAYRALGRTEEAREEARRFLAIGRAHPDAVEAEEFLGAGGGAR